MLKLGRVTKVKVLFRVLVFVFNFDFKFSAAILEKGLFLSFSRGRSNKRTKSGRAKEHAWGEKKKWGEVGRG